jgi:hypothetical protein
MRRWDESMNSVIQKLEGLLAYAVAHNDAVEAARIRAELTRIVEGL